MASRQEVLTDLARIKAGEVGGHAFRHADYPSALFTLIVTETGAFLEPGVTEELKAKWGEGLTYDGVFTPEQAAELEEQMINYEGA